MHLGQTGLSGEVGVGAAISPYLALDTFQATDGTSLDGRTPDIGPAWSVLTNAAQITTITDANGVSKKALVQNGAGSNTFAVLDSGHADVTVSIYGSIGRSDTNCYTGLCLRMTDANNGWLLFLSHAEGGVTLYKIQTGSFTAIVHRNIGALRQDQYHGLAITAIGTKITICIDNVQYYDFDVGSFNATATKHGVALSNTVNNQSVALQRFSVATAPYGVGSLPDVGGIVGIPVVVRLGAVGTFTCDDSLWAQSPAGTFTFTPIFEDAGTFRTPTFSDGTTNRKINVPIFPDFDSWAQDSGNPLLHTYNDFPPAGQQDMVYFTPLDWLPDGTVQGMGTINSTQDDHQDDLGCFQTTQASLLRTWTEVSGNPAVARSATPTDWDHQELLHPTGSVGPATSGPLAGNYVRYYCAVPDALPVFSKGIGIVYSSDRKPPWTKWSGNPWLNEGGPCSAWQDATTIHFYAPIVTGLGYWTVPLADPTQVPTFVGTVIAIDTQAIPTSATRGNIYEFFVYRDPSGSLEGAYSTTDPALLQIFRYVLSLDGITWYALGFPPFLSTAPWATNDVGDAVLTRIRNWRYLYYAAQVNNALGGNGGAAGLFKAQSPTTGHFLTIATTTYDGGETTYAVSPNGATAVNMTAVPASGQTVVVTVSAYAAGGVTMTVSCTNGVSVSFTLNGMTVSHTYTVKKNGTTIATPTSSAGGVLTFSNSVWSGTDTLTVT